MDFRDEVRVGTHTYGVRATSESASDGEPSKVAVELTGASLDDGRVVAEGNLVLHVDALADSGLFLTRTLEGMAALHGQAGPARKARAAQRPPRAGQPWTTDLDELVRTRWMNGTDQAGSALVAELARELGRSRRSVRVRLARVGCDPDSPGRLLNGAADP